MGLGALAAWLATVRVGPYTLWIFVRELVPAADAIRGPVRIQIVMAFPVVIAAFVGLQNWWNNIRSIKTSNLRRLAVACFITAVGILAAETVRFEPKHAFSNAAESSYLSSFQPPPPGCRAFYARVSGDSSRPALIRNIDASLLAITLGIPTINGPTQKKPSGWDLRDLEHTDYDLNVKGWIDHAGLSDVCTLNIDTGEWSAGQDRGWIDR